MSDDVKEVKRCPKCDARKLRVHMHTIEFACGSENPHLGDWENESEACKIIQSLQSQNAELRDSTKALLVGLGCQNIDELMEQCTDKTLFGNLGTMYKEEVLKRIGFGRIQQKTDICFNVFPPKLKGPTNET